MTEGVFSTMRTFLADHTVLTLATIGPNGHPQATDLYYADANDLTLHFISSPGSRHVRNIEADRRVAATIHADSTRWRDIRGVQLEGVCARLSGVGWAEAWTCYLTKFPFVLTDAVLDRALQQVEIYRVIPYWLRWIDNTTGFGHNPEWTLDEGRWARTEGT
jgi:uncharacterized protein YhbP (UPF0306 family)